MRSFVVSAVLAGALVACSVELPPARPAVVATEDESPFGVDPRVRDRNQAKRFPGVRALDLVKVVISTHERSALCRTELAPSRETAVRVEYALEGETRGRGASSLAELEAQGWHPVYRSLDGRGFELRAPFRSIDLALTTGFACVCSSAAPGRPKLLEGDRRSVELRFRWEKGAMPAVSARSAHDGKRRALRPTLTSGGLFGYEFTEQAAFPDGNLGRCGVRVDLGLLVDPAIG